MFHLSTNNIEKNNASNSSWSANLSILLLSTLLMTQSTLAQEEATSDTNQEEKKSDEERGARGFGGGSAPSKKNALTHLSPHINNHNKHGKIVLHAKIRKGNYHMIFGCKIG